MQCWCAYISLVQNGCLVKLNNWSNILARDVVFKPFLSVINFLVRVDLSNYVCHKTGVAVKTLKSFPFCRFSKIEEIFISLIKAIKILYSIFIMYNTWIQYYTISQFGDCIKLISQLIKNISRCSGTFSDTSFNLSGRVALLLREFGKVSHLNFLTLKTYGS